MLRSGKRSLKRMRLVQAAGNGGAALDFDGQETPVGQFDDEVDLEAVDVAEVVQGVRGAAPGLSLDQFEGHELFHQCPVVLAAPDGQRFCRRWCERWPSVAWPGQLSPMASGEVVQPWVRA